MFWEENERKSQSFQIYAKVGLVCLAIRCLLLVRLFFLFSQPPISHLNCRAAWTILGVQWRLPNSSAKGSQHHLMAGLPYCAHWSWPLQLAHWFYSVQRSCHWIIFHRPDLLKWVRASLGRYHDGELTWLLAVDWKRKMQEWLGLVVGKGNMAGLFQDHWQCLHIMLEFRRWLARCLPT